MTVYCKHCERPFEITKVKGGIQNIKCTLCNKLFRIMAHVTIEVIKGG